jgi:hypothetical protein
MKRAAKLAFGNNTRAVGTLGVGLAVLCQDMVYTVYQDILYTSEEAPGINQIIFPRRELSTQARKKGWG